MNTNMNDEKKLSLAEFSPAEAQLTELANKAKSVDITNIVAVHDARIDLRDARVALTKKGKELREGALQFQKSVIAKEKDLLGIITPEEDRLDAIETEHKQKVEMEKRRVELPTRRAALTAIVGPDAMQPDDEFILKMDDAEFNEYRLKVVEAKLEQDKRDAEAKQREADRLAREKLDAERAEFEKAKKIEDDKRRAEQAEIEKEKARLAGIESERVRQENIKKAETERLEREAKLAADKIEADKKAAAEAEAKAQADARFKAFLVEVGFDERTDHVTWSIDKTTAGVYRKIGTYNITK